MHLARVAKILVFLLLAASLQALTCGSSYAVPSFARQTGFSCFQCHTVWPELTTLGRTFKLSGYVMSKSNKIYQFPPPIAGMVQASYTHTDKAQPSDTVKNEWSSNFITSGNDNASIPQQMSLFYGGKVLWKVGALVQGTYDGVQGGDAFFLDNSDLRFSDSLTLGGKQLIYGAMINNFPTVGDVWNTTPAWGFPYASSGVAPGPAAAALIDGPLGQQVGGGGLYAFWNNLLYVQMNLYRTTDDGVTEFLGAGTPTDTIVDGALPYWRVAVQHVWGSHSLEIGTYGLYADVYPGGFSSGPTDHFTDIGIDAQYQYVTGKHIFTVASTWIHENQDWDASHEQGLTDSSDTLDTYRINFNYYYRSTYGTVGGNFAFFNTWGSRDNLLYAPDPVDGSRNGEPDSRGFIFQLDYLPWERTKFQLQYTLYDKFNGSHSNYDGFGRDAFDNNTLYFLAWFMF